MTSILILQATYIFAGALFNLISLMRERRGLQRLAPTNPIAGMRSMATAACILASFFVVPSWLFAIAWLVFAIRLMIRSIIPHFLAIKHHRNIENYTSTVSAGLAFGINVFGLIFGLLGGATAIA